MEYKNHKITEAVSAFRFNPDVNTWDITSIAEYYNAIKDHGFKKKQEIQPVELSFQVGPNVAQRTEMRRGESQMVFKKDEEDYAILVGNNYISFHTLNHYPGWEVFNETLISPFIKKYFDLKYGKGLTSAQMIYINNFEIGNDRKLSDYLTFVPDMEHFGDGDELSHMFQSAYDISPNKRLQLKTILNVTGPEKTKKVTLECNCIANNTVNNNIPWNKLSQEAHDSAKNAFIKIATEEFKKEIK